MRVFDLTARELRGTLFESRIELATFLGSQIVGIEWSSTADVANIAEIDRARTLDVTAYVERACARRGSCLRRCFKDFAGRPA